ncbi:uncharacterized protein BJX67DRAFT_377396 [Aspergillus lucknowensis]|uniref:Endo-chitosanase n=1 Tax=Aspergillus lucknowensis TaxID=176173 RepID=A0ABR4M4X0_9EURO
MEKLTIRATPLCYGVASGRLLYSDEPLNFSTGIERENGHIIDPLHALCGQHVEQCILDLPSSSGIYGGSLAVAEPLASRTAPAGFIFTAQEQAVTAGVILAWKMANFPELYVPVLRVSRVGPVVPPQVLDQYAFELSAEDKEILTSKYNHAARQAMKMLLRFALATGAPALVPVNVAHINSSIHNGGISSSLALTFQALGGQFAVKTSITAASIYRQRWTQLGDGPSFSARCDDIERAYLAMGAQHSRELSRDPLNPVRAVPDDVWMDEPQAAVFQNSVYGAEFPIYPEGIHVCIALTGRASDGGIHTWEGRKPGVAVDIFISGKVDDTFYALLGYAVGKLSCGRIPLVRRFGPLDLRPSVSDLKTFAAAFATTGSVPVFHIVGATYRATQFNRNDYPRVTICQSDLMSAQRALTTATDSTVKFIVLGNPSVSLWEFMLLGILCRGVSKAKCVDFVITTNKQVYTEAVAGYVEAIRTFGGQIIVNSPVCSPVECAPDGGNLMTNSTRYAQYDWIRAQRRLHFGSFRQCVAAARWGMVDGWEFYSFTLSSDLISNTCPHHASVQDTTLLCSPQRKKSPRTCSPSTTPSATPAPATGTTCSRAASSTKPTAPHPSGATASAYIRGHGLYLKGPGDTLANMDIDCYGQNVTDDNDGRCHRSRDTQFETSFRDIVRGYGYGIPDLNPYIHPYVVLGNAGGHWPFYRSFDQRTVDVQPLSLVAVVCNNQLFYGVWGDVNGDDGVLPLVGEASLALATACFGHGAVDEDTGYDGTDVLYLAFSGGEAVPGVTARWDARSFEEFEGSVEGLGDWLVRRVVSGNTSCLGV